MHDPQRRELSRTLSTLLIAFILIFTVTGPARSQPATARTSPQLATRFGKYAVVQLTTDLSKLTPAERRMIPLLIDAADAMNEVFWLQAYGDKTKLLDAVDDPHLRRFAEINFGPWDRLDANRPFIDGVGPKPPGAQFYPGDMSREEFEDHLAKHPDDAAEFRGLYSVVRRDDQRGLVAIPYHVAYRAQHELAAQRLREAAELAEDNGLRRYLNARAAALLSDEYQESDLVWMDMKTNRIDCVIGPIETYEDQLFGYKAAHECYVLVKDLDWSGRLSRYAKMLPDLQRSLPVDEKYKRETPGLDSDLNAYDVIYYAGDCASGSKTIAINLPNDEEVQLQKGSRRLQLKNAMQVKFDTILNPIADLLIVPEQRQHVTFDAFFNNTMFHEVAHGLGIKETITGRGRVRESLRDLSGSLEEGKADILGLYMITHLSETDELPADDLMDHYVTFMASVFRSVRFGASSAHGRANTMRFNFFEQQGAFVRDANGRYRIEFDQMKRAMTSLTAKILMLQGDGDYEGAVAWMNEVGEVSPTLQADLERVNQAGIPVDIVLDQGLQVLGLTEDGSLATRSR